MYAYTLCYRQRSVRSLVFEKVLIRGFFSKGLTTDDTDRRLRSADTDFMACGKIVLCGEKQIESARRFLSSFATLIFQRAQTIRVTRQACLDGYPCHPWLNLLLYCR
jgi:hypothetical protein